MGYSPILQTRAQSPTPSPAAREGPACQLSAVEQAILQSSSWHSGVSGIAHVSRPSRANWSLAQSLASAGSWQGAMASRQLGGAGLVAASPMVCPGQEPDGSTEVTPAAFSAGRAGCLSSGKEDGQASAASSGTRSRPHRSLNPGRPVPSLCSPQSLVPPPERVSKIKGPGPGRRAHSVPEAHVTGCQHRRKQRCRENPPQLHPLQPLGQRWA